MKVLLLSPPFLRNYMRNARCDFVSLSGSQWYPLHLGYCGAWLERCGHNVNLIDAPAYNLNKRDVMIQIQEFNPDWIVLYSGRLSEDSDIAFADEVSSEACKVVISGAYASMDPVATLAKSSKVSYLIYGEFEHPLQELIEGREPGSIKNLVFKKDSAIISNPPREYLTGDQLDQIPFVSSFFKKQVDLRRYKTVSERFPFMDILTGRGCAWGKCSYCLWAHTYVKGSVYNSRSVENVIDELQFIRTDMPEVKSVMFQDDTMTDDRLLEICDAKLRAGNTLAWSCYTRANLKLSTLHLMKRAGCLNLHTGFESGNKMVLKEIRKGVTVDQMVEFVKNAKKVRLRIHGDFAIGFPGETRESIQETIRLAHTLRPHTAQFQLMIPFKGTPFHAKLLSLGNLTADERPDFPGLSADDLERFAKRAYFSYYFSFNYLLEIIRHPFSMLLSRITTYSESLISLIFRKYIR